MSKTLKLIGLFLISLFFQVVAIGNMAVGAVGLLIYEPVNFEETIRFFVNFGAFCIGIILFTLWIIVEYSASMYVIKDGVNNG